MTTNNDIQMYFTGQRCPRCGERTYTDNFCIWCKKECEEHGRRVERK